MKQYIMGMLTGVSLILCAVMFMGNAQSKYDIPNTVLALHLESMEVDISEIGRDVGKVEEDVSDLYYTVIGLETRIKNIQSDAKAIRGLNISGVNCNNLYECQ